MSRSPLPYILVPGLILVASLFIAVACGGTETPEDPPPVCYSHHPIPADGGMMRNLSAEDWANLAVRGYHEGAEASQDCVGNPLQWRPTDDSCDVHEPEDEEAPDAVALTEESVVVGRSSSVARKPVWVITHEFEDGDGWGPVILTQRNDEGVAVRAIGTMRLPRERARLRLRESGGQEFIVADGERCPESDEDPADAPTNVADGEETGEEASQPACLRYARILPLVGDRLLTPEVRDRGDGHCLGPAQVYLAREETIGVENGWERRFRLAASMEYRGGAIIIHEQVTAQDSDPRDPGRPARLFRTTDSDRVIYLRRGGMRSQGVPLFERSVRAHGSTQLPIAESDRSEEQSGSERGR